MALSSDEQAQRELQAMDEEARLLVPLVGSALLTWSALENALCTTFNSLAFPSPWDNVSGIGPAIFYSPNSFEARVRLVHDVLLHKYTYLDKHQNKADGDYIVKTWSAIRERVKRKQGRRNTLAHGMLMTSYGPDGRSTNIMLPASLHVFENKKKVDAAEIRDFISGCKWLMELINKFNQFLIYINDFQHKHHHFPNDQEYNAIKTELDMLLTSHP